MKSLLPLWKYILRYKMAFSFGVVFVILANLFQVTIPVIVGETVNTLTNRPGLLGDLAVIGMYIIALAGIGGAFRFLMRRVLIDTSRDVEYDFRNDVYKKLQDLDPSFYDNQNTGDIMSRMTNDIDAVRMMVGPAIMYSVNTVVMVPLVLVAMIRQDAVISLLALLPMMVMPIVVRVLGKEMHRRFRVQQDQLGDLTTSVQESIAGVRVIKAYGQEASYDENFVGENQKYIDKSMRAAILQAWVWPLIRMFSGLGGVIVLALGMWRIQEGAMQIGDLLSIIMLFGMLVWPLVAAGWVVNLFQRAAASMDRIVEVTSKFSKVADEDGSAHVDVLPASLDVDFKDMTFTYPGAMRPALRNINLSVPAGKTIGIVGRVGSGKSTLVNLLLRFYPLERGQMHIGGVDINNWPLNELRRRVSIVFQETFLFSETIAENIQFGAHTELDFELITEAAAKADVHKDIVGFPGQYDTKLGERGVNLSGGQKQRVSMARALVRDASILILDDCLSAVDTHTEEAILSTLREEMKGRTTFLISHRISTVALADEIIVLEDGEITERGTHEELAAQGGLYAELHRKQLLEEEVEAIG